MFHQEASVETIKLITTIRYQAVLEGSIQRDPQTSLPQHQRFCEESHGAVHVAIH